MTTKPDDGPKWSVNDAVGAVASNIQYLNRDDKERVLLAVAVLYGIIEPIRPAARSAPVPKPAKKSKRSAR